MHSLAVSRNSAHIVSIVSIEYGPDGPVGSFFESEAGLKVIEWWRTHMGLLHNSAWRP